MRYRLRLSLSDIESESSVLAIIMLRLYTPALSIRSVLLQYQTTHVVLNEA